MSRVSLGTDFNPVLITCPFWDVRIKASSSLVRIWAATIEPAFSVKLAALTPTPPRSCIGQASIEDFLPMPLSVITRRCAFVSSLVITSMPISSSWGFNLMPRTPMVSLAIGLTFSSLNFIDMPFLEITKTVSSPEVSFAQRNASPGDNLIAMIPDFLIAS